MSRNVVWLVAGLAVGVGVVGWRAVAAPAPSPAPTERVKWEYRVLYPTNGEATDQTVPKVVSVGTEWDTGPMANRLAELGADGWELVTVQEFGGQPAVYVFKRPR